MRDFDSTVYVRRVTLDTTPDEHILKYVVKGRGFSREWIPVLESMVNVSPQVRHGQKGDRAIEGSRRRDTVRHIFMG